MGRGLRASSGPGEPLLVNSGEENGDLGLNARVLPATVLQKGHNPNDP